MTDECVTGTLADVTEPSAPSPTDAPSGLPSLLGPGATVVTMELERGVVGDLATLTQLRDCAQDRGTLDACGRLVSAARSQDVAVVHCIAEWRADRRGTALNAPLTRALARNPAQILAGSDAVELIDELGDTSNDLTSVRRHGLTPFTGTDLDAVLRSLGTTTVIVCGVSLNVGVLGLCLTAADLGYRVVVASDAVVGVPADYGDAVIANTLAMVATITTVDALI
jgi:nicotinamidase-related amidase